jgi:hypothetical protein
MLKRSFSYHKAPGEGYSLRISIYGFCASALIPTFSREGRGEGEYPFPALPNGKRDNLLQRAKQQLALSVGIEVAPHKR